MLQMQSLAMSSMQQKLFLPERSDQDLCKSQFIIIIIHLVTKMTRYVVQKAKPVGVQPKLQTKNNYLAI